MTKPKHQKAPRPYAPTRGWHYTGQVEGSAPPHKSGWFLTPECLCRPAHAYDPGEPEGRTLVSICGKCGVPKRIRYIPAKVADAAGNALWPRMRDYQTPSIT